MVNRQIRLSIIIPLYNVEKYISQCLTSIVQSNEVDPTIYEIIIVDDGSTDKSLSIVEDFASTQNNIRIVRQKNKGVSKARMNGLSISKGDFIWFIDSDDYLISGAINTVLQLLERYPEPDVFVIQMQLYYEKTGARQTSPYSPIPERFISGKEYLQRIPMIICPVQFIIRRGMFANPDIYFPEGLRHEDEYFSRVLQYNSSLMYVSDELLYVYRQREDSYMHTMDIQHLYDMVEIYRLLSRFVHSATDLKDRDWLQRDIFSFLISSYFYFTAYFFTAEFHKFHRRNKRFIRQEFYKNAQFLPLKTFWIDLLILYCPQLFLILFRVHHWICSKN